MMQIVRIVGIDCLFVLAGACVLAVLLRFGRAVLDALPMSRARRASLARVRPAVAAVLMMVYAITAVRWVLETDDRREWVAFVVVLGIGIAASWSVLRNAFEGVTLRVARSFEIGDRIDIGGIQGRVHRLGVRTLVVETADGQLAIIPYRTAAATTIRREPFGEQSAFHVFRIPIPEGRPISELKRAVHEAALLCHWSSTRRLPQVTATDDGHLEITLFPVDANHVTDIERVVRRALG